MHRLSTECFTASLPLLPGSSRAPSTSEPSRSLNSSMSLARSTHHRVLDLALLHPIVAQLGLLGSTVHAYGHVPSWTSGGVSGDSPDAFSSTFSLCGSVFTPCGTSSGTSAPAAWSHWVALTIFTTFSNTPYLSACCWPRSFPHGSGVPTLALSPWVLGSQPLAVFSFFRSLWHVFRPTHPTFSMPTSPSESRLSIHPWTQSSQFRRDRLQEHTSLSGE